LLQEAEVEVVKWAEAEEQVDTVVQFLANPLVVEQVLNQLHQFQGQVPIQ
tara:strand:- start:368 stop:517 length:150 start_codon:yes stop_codon:yes gene_type:complete